MHSHASFNRIYRLVWSALHQTWVVASELAGGRGKSSSTPLLSSALLASLVSLSGGAGAAPQGGQVISGSGSISTSINASGTTTTITQASDKLSLNWQSFNVGKTESVNFLQPSPTALAVNRIFDTQGSQILGRISANGQVWLINPNGVLFGKDAQINVGGLVASTLNPDDASIGSARSNFSGSSTAGVVNLGSINAAQGGYVALLGHSVSNSGQISAPGGTVALGAGSAVSLNFAGSKLLGLEVTTNQVNALAENGGLIQADGGQVLLSAGARESLLASVVNNTGVIQARTVQEQDGKIILLGGMAAGTTNVGGTLDASAPSGDNGGFIETSAYTVNVSDSASITTASAQGTQGQWLIDPFDFYVATSGGNITGSTLGGQLGNNNMTIQTTAAGTGGLGDIFVNDAVTWTSDKILTLQAYRNININSPITASNGGLTLTAGRDNSNPGTISVASGVAVGAFSLTRGDWRQLAEQLPIFSATSFGVTSSGSGGNSTSFIRALRGDGSSSTSPYRITDVYGLQGIGSSTITRANFYELGNDINASGTSSWDSNKGFSPIGNAGTTDFAGSFDGKGYTISGLWINRVNVQMGLFRELRIGGVVKNVGLVNAGINGQRDFGGLVGVNNGSISNSYVTGSVTGTGTGRDKIGGLVGINNGTISNSYATSSVTGISNVGGLVGSNTGTITINSSSYASGSVTGTGSEVGGLVGSNTGSITINSSSYALGSVTGIDNIGGFVGSNTGTISISSSDVTVSVSGRNNVGGLVGSNIGTGTISISSSDVTGSDVTGTVVGTGNSVGGLVGSNTGTGTISDSNATGNVTGVNNVGGLVGSNTGTGYIINSSYATGNINGNSSVGGLVGSNTGNNTGTGSIINSSYATGNVYGSSSVGGLVGSNTGNNTGIGSIINSSYATGNVNGTGNSVGGLVGSNTGNNTGTGSIINSSYATGNVDGSSNVGGLVGYNTGTGSTINSSYAATGGVTGTGTSTGGLVGYNTGTIDRSYATTGNIRGNTKVGGLVGVNGGGTIISSYATGNVTGIDVGENAYFGGLVGHNNGGTISNSYATGSASGSYAIGGLVGLNNGTIDRSYASGSVTAIGTDGDGNTYAGGLVGQNNDGSISSSYFDKETTGQASGVGSGEDTTVTGLTSTEMKQASNFSGFDASTWLTYDGYTAPLLRSFLTPLSATYTVSGSKTYDGTTACATITCSYTTGTLTSGKNLLGTSSLAVSSKNAGSVTGAGLYSDQQGYAISASTNGTATITKAPLTITGDSDSTTYTGVAQTLTGYTASGLLGSDTVSSLSGVSASASGTNAGSYTNSVTASTQTNYTVTTANGTLTINKKALSVSGTTAAGKTYDGNTLAAIAVGTLSGFVNSETVSATASGTFDSQNAGSRTATASYTLANGTGLASNYSLANTTHSATIDKKALSVSGTTAANKTYDGNNTAAITLGTLSGFVNGETVSASASGTFGTKDVGTGKFVRARYTLLDGTGLASNYSLADTTGLRANITKAPLTITGNSASTAYTGEAQTLSGFTASGLAGSDTVSSLSGVSASGASGTNAGSYTNSVTAATQTNYEVTTANGTLTINKKALTITGDSASTTYTGVAQTLSGFTAIGLAGSDTISSLSGVSASVSGTNAGSYTNSVTADTQTNYEVTTANGTLTINKKALSVSGTTAAGKTYDGNTLAAITVGTLSGFVNGEAVSASASGTFDSQNAGSRTATASYTLANGTGLASNYSLANTTGHSATIAQKALTVSGTTAANKTYDGNTTAAITVGTLSGLVNSETVSATASGTFDSQNAGSRTATASYTLANGANGGLASNYSLDNTPGLAATITKAPLTITGDSTSTTYNGAAQTLSGFTASGLVPGETISSLSGVSASVSGTNAGSYTNSVTAPLQTNYEVTTENGTLTINKKALSVSGTTAAGKTYDGNTLAAIAVGTLSGFVNSETVSATASGTFDSQNAGSRTATASYTLANGTGLASNYSLANTAHSATIAQKALTYTADAASFATGTNPTGLTGTLSGFVNLETQSTATTGMLMWVTAATSASGAGRYAINGSGLLANNYSFSQAEGNSTALTLTQAAAPVVTPPQAAAPVVTPPQAAAPVVTPPQAAAPAVTPPQAATPVVTPPQAATPVVTPPQTAAPVVTPPQAAAPVVTPPQAAAPVATPPQAAAPVATPPQDAAPVATPPQAATPVVTPPQDAAPVVTPPQAAAPVATPPQTTASVVTPTQTTSFVPVVSIAPLPSNTSLVKSEELALAGQRFRATTGLNSLPPTEAGSGQALGSGGISNVIQPIGQSGMLYVQGNGINLPTSYDQTPPTNLE